MTSSWSLTTSKISSLMLSEGADGGAGSGQGCGAPAQQFLGELPANAGVRDGNAITQLSSRARKGLVAFFEIAFHHDADERLIAAGFLLDQAAPYFLLASMLLAGIGMTAIDT